MNCQNCKTEIDIESPERCSNCNVRFWGYDSTENLLKIYEKEKAKQAAAEKDEARRLAAEKEKAEATKNAEAPEVEEVVEVPIEETQELSANSSAKKTGLSKATLTLIVTAITASLGVGGYFIYQSNFFEEPAYSENYDEPANEYAQVTAKSGLNMRTGPSLKDKKISTVPFEAKVIVLEKGKKQTIYKKSANWYRVQYQAEGIEGWVWGGFLKLR